MSDNQMSTLDILKMRSINDKNTIAELRDNIGLLCINIAAQEATIHELRHELAKVRAANSKLHDKLETHHGE